MAETLTLRPNEDIVYDSGYDDWICSEGVDRYALLNESVLDETKYVYTDGTCVSFYAFPDHATEEGTIYYVRICSQAKIDADSGTYYHSIGTPDLGYTDSPSHELNYPDPTSYMEDTWYINPVTGLAWEWSDIDALTVGISSGGSKYDVDCYQLYMEVSYEPPPVPVLTPVWISQGKFFIERPTFKIGTNDTITGVWGRQSTAVLGEPFAQKVTNLWNVDTTFYAICQDIIESVGLTWDPLNCEISDFAVYADNFESDDQYPIEALQSLVELVVGAEGYVTSDRLGNVCIKRLSREPITSDYDVTDLVVQSINEEPEWPEFGNRIKIIPSESVSQDSVIMNTSSECLGMSSLTVSYIDIFAQAKNGEGIPINDSIITWKFSPAGAKNLGFLYPVSGATYQKEVYQNTSILLISKEMKRASGVRIIETNFEASSIVGIWAYADKSRSYNFAPIGGYVIDGNKVYLTLRSFYFCDQMVVISYFAAGMVMNSVKYDPVNVDPSLDDTFGEVLVIASLSGKENTKSIYINNNCKCSSSLAVNAFPTTIEVGQQSTINAYAENSGEPVSGIIRMVETASKGTLQWGTRTTAVTLITNEKAESINSIVGVTQCVASSGISSVVGVYKTHIVAPTTEETADTSVNYYSSFTGRTIDLTTFITTGTNLMIDYYRAGSVVNYLTGTAAGTAQVVTSLDVNTEEGLSQTTSITVNAVPVIIVPDPTPDPPPVPPPPTPVTQWIATGPTVIYYNKTGLNQNAGPFSIRSVPSVYVAEYYVHISVSGNGYLPLSGKQYFTVGGNAWGQTVTVTVYYDPPNGGAQVSATINVALIP